MSSKSRCMPKKNYTIESFRTVRKRLHKSIQNKPLEHRILAVFDFTRGRDSATLAGFGGWSPEVIRSAVREIACLKKSECRKEVAHTDGGLHENGVGSAKTH